MIRTHRLFAARSVATGLVLPVAALLLAGASADARGPAPKRTTVTEIIVHATGGPSCEGGRVRFSAAGTVRGMKRFFEAPGGVSIHYIIGRDGTVAKSVPEDEVARHTRDNNEHSIGIELINAGDGVEPFPNAQIEALARLIQVARVRWSIPLAEIKGHDHVDRSTFRCGAKTVQRKQDPGPLFPWDRLHMQLLLAEMAETGARPVRR